jgi:hypothetical protein
MQTTDPPLLKHAGDVVFPDVASSLPVQIIGLAGVAWLFFAPVWVGFSARRHDGRRAFARYLLGVLVMAAFLTVQSGLMGESLTQRLAVWARHIWLPTFAIALVLSGFAAAVGHLTRRPRPSLR